MSDVFPLGLPAPTTLYLCLYVVTLVAHVVFMNYTLAGAVILGVETARGRASGPVATMLRDWLTFALSLAITAGVAPLLFVQILYREGFYTANLLLGTRWMAVVPALIAGFYLLYAAKIERVSARKWLAVAVSVGAVLCFVFVGYSFTENHLLSVSPAEWSGVYTRGDVAWWSRAILPRYGMFFVGAFPTVAIGLAWQLRKVREVHKGLGVLAIGALAVSAVALGIWVASLGAQAQGAVLGAPAGPWLAVAVAGGLVQAASWAWSLRAGLGRSALLGATVGVTMTLLGMTCVREVVRLATADLAALAPQHAHAAQSGGLFVFLAFLLINGVLIAWAVAQARKATP